MLHLIKPLAFFFLISCLPAHAASPSSADHLKRISSLTNWDEVYALAKKTLPPLIVDELKKATMNTPFPQIRVSRGQLAISGSDGGRVNLAFTNNGVATLNGKPLNLLPLATVDAEIKRLEALPAEKRASASLLRYLIPDANAAMIGTGLAALVYSGANSWKADACGEEELGSEELEKTCPLMGVGMIHNASATEEAPATEEEKRRMKFHPISFKCPDRPGDGLLEIVKKNENGSTYRGRFYIKDRSITRISLEIAMAGEKFEVMKDLKISSALPDEDKTFAKNAAKTIDPVREVVCEGTKEDRTRYLSLIEDNRKAFKKITEIRSEEKESVMQVQ